MLKIEKYLPYAVGFTAFLIFLLTIAPSVVQIDSGELAAIQILPGIAHPTGYPLFSILGYLFSLLPLPVTKIFQMNILAAIYTATGAGVLARTLLLVLNKLPEYLNVEKQRKANRVRNVKVKELNKKSIHPQKLAGDELPQKILFTPNIKILAVTFASLILIVSRTFWSQSTSVEVYSLQILMFCVLQLFLLKAFFTVTVKTKSIDKINITLAEKIKTICSDSYEWFLFAIILALSFSNHMTSILILPGTAYLYFIKNGITKKSIKQLAIMLAIFFPLLGVLYSYLMIRASYSPLVNWGNPIDFEFFMRHVSGKQYTVWLFSSMDSAAKQFEYFVNNLFDEFRLGLVFAIIGIFYAFFKSKKLAGFFLINFIFTVLYSINYDINDIDSYFLLAYISLSVFILFAIIWFYGIAEKYKLSSYFVVATLGFVTISTGYLNYPEVTQRGNYAFEDYTKAILETTDKNGVILSYQWDYFISASYYYQYVEKNRPDVTILDKELLRRSWYFNQLKSSHPDVYERLRPELDEFKRLVAPFEKSAQYDPTSLEASYQAVLTKVITGNTDRTVYLAPELVENEMQKREFVLPEGYQLVPDLFFFKVVKSKEYIPLKDFKVNLRTGNCKNKYVDNIKNILSRMIIGRILYETENRKFTEAKVMLNKLKREFPDVTIPDAIEKAVKAGG